MIEQDPAALATHQGGEVTASAGPRPIPWITDLMPAIHGAYHARGGPSAQPVLDFSANGNVIGPPPGVAAAIASVDVSRYPDPEAWELRLALARRNSVSPEWVLAGNGSTELIWAIARAYLAPADRVLVCGPTYGEYGVASGAAGASVQVTTTPADIDDIAAAIRAVQPRIIWLCHPNNPTGSPFPIARLPELLAAAPQVLFVVDEAYLSLCADLDSALPLIPTGQVAVLQSMTKDMALAGLRVGAMLASPPLVDTVRRVVPPWSVSSVAQAAGTVACKDPLHLDRARAAVARSRAHLVAGLRALGLDPLPSVANFVLVDVHDARAVTERLLGLGCAVRDCTSFGLPGRVRIGVRSILDQEVLLTALRTVLSGPPRDG